MFNGLFIVSLVTTIVQLTKEKCATVIPSENWENKELIHKDQMNGVSAKEFQNNLANGKYKMTEKYIEPHRNANGQIIIENSKLYKEDLLKYGAVQTMKWVKQGKYNLTNEELRKEHERINKNFDYMYSLLQK